MKPRHYFFGRLLLPAAALISFSGSAHAADGLWDFGGSSNDWQTAANWNPDGLPGTTSAFASTETATFGTAGSGTINLGNLINIRDIRFGNGFGNSNAFIIGDANDTLNLSNSTNTTNGMILMGTGVTTSEQIGVSGTLIKLSTTANSTYSFTNNSNTALAQLLIAGAVSTSAASGTSTLTLNGTNGGTVSGVVSNGGTATMALTKGGLGTWTLTGANTYTGNTTISGGVLKLDFTASGAPSTNIISSTSALKLGGGTLQIQGASSVTSAQTVASTTLNSGGSTISLSSGVGGTLNTNFGVITRNAGGTVEITAPTSGTINVGATTLGYWAVLNGTDYVTKDASNNLISKTYNNVSGNNGTTTGDINATGNINFNSQVFFSSLRFNSPSATAATGSNVYINALNLLVGTGEGANNVTISGMRQSSSSAGGEFIFNQENTLGYATINSLVVKTGTSTAITKFGAGTLFLANSNPGGGTVSINGGAIVTGADAGLGPVSTATLALGGGNFYANGTFTTARPVTLSGNGGGLGATTGNVLEITSVISGGSPLNIGFNQLMGSGAGTANTTAVVGNGTVSLTGPNSYSGGTTVKAGTLQINGINALGGANYGGLTLDGGTLKYASGFSGNGSGDLTSIGTAGITIASGGGTIDTTGNSVAYAGSIGNGGGGSLTKTGGGTLTLSAANTYTGGTFINGGTLTAGNSSSLGTGALTINTGGTLSNGAFTLGVGAVTLTGSANFLLAGVTSPITSTGAVSISGSSNFLTVGGSAAAAGNIYTLLSGTSLTAAGISLTGTAVGGSTVALGSSSTVGRTNYAFSSTSTALQLAVTGGAFNLTWNGGNANWNTTDANWKKDGTGSNIVFFTGDNITISTGDSIAVDAGGITAGTLLVNNTSGTATLTGGALGMVSLTKSGAGSLVANDAITSSTGINVQAGSMTLNVANTISGAITVSGGILALGTSNAAGTGAASLTVSGGELALGASNQSLTNVSLTSGSITGTSGVLTGTGSAFDMQSGSVSAKLAGSIGLSKTTAGTVTLSGANTYAGATTVSDGTLSLSGSLTGSNITTSGAGIFSQSSGGVIAGTGTTFTQGSSGTSVLSGVNTYTGATSVKNGTLVLDGGSNRLLNSGIVVLGDTATTGKLVLGGTTTADQTLTGLTTTGSGGSVVGGNASNSTLTLDIAGTNTYGGTLGGAGTNENNLTLNKSGAGTLTLSAANTYTGGTQLNAGTLIINAGSALGIGTLTAANGTIISLTTASGVGNAITVTGLNASVTLTSNQPSVGYGGNFTGSADQTLRIGSNPVNMNNTTRQFANFLGTVNVLSGSTLSDRNTNVWTNGGDSTLFNVDGYISSRNGGQWALGGLTGAGTLSMGTSGSNGSYLNYTIGARNDANDVFSGVIKDGDTATNKLVTVTKVGTGIQTLSDTNTYTGATAVNAGTLMVTGSVSGSAVTVNNSGTVLASGTTGTIGQSVTVKSGAILAAGGVNAVGAATVGSGGLVFNTGSIFDWDINANSTVSGFDTVSAGGNIDVSTTGTVFKVVFGAGVNLTDAFWNTPNTTQTWSMASIFGQAFNSGSFASVVSTADPLTQGSFTINGSNLTWTSFSAVPEPTSVA